MAKRSAPNTIGKAVPKPTGRPSLYTQELVDTICDRLIQGEPLAVICRTEGYPDPATVWRWAKDRPDLSQAIAHARELGFDAIAARVRLTARGKTEESGGDSSGDVQRDKLIIETDLKLLSKWDPKRYGDRINLDHSGEMKVTLSAEQRKARIAALLAKAVTPSADGS